ncbi:hypothetical protein AB0O34_10065 [Sphaerisporangium sp. NPDC088356]|uniref:hypothetical protein n=1 Tax=Sphaerisporangium sp. NPDC088356 TaxID=3154871 RepID=UPI00341A5652
MIALAPTPTPVPTVTVTQTVAPTSIPTPVITITPPDAGIDPWKDVVWGNFGGALIGALIALGAALIVWHFDKRQRIEDGYRQQATDIYVMLDRAVTASFDRDWALSHRYFVQFLVLARDIPRATVRSRRSRLALKLRPSVRRAVVYGDMRGWLLDEAEKISAFWKTDKPFGTQPEERKALITLFLVVAPRGLSTWRSDQTRWTPPWKPPILVTSDVPDSPWYRDLDGTDR